MSAEKIPIGSDHGGISLKRAIIDYLKEHGFEPVDMGTHSDESCDYPDYGIQVAHSVSQKNYTRGILVCGTGIGMSITANKFGGVRATLCHDTFTAKMSREHNDSNLLVLGGRVLSADGALEIVDIWLKTEFEGGRHVRRLDKIKDLEDRLTNGNGEV